MRIAELIKAVDKSDIEEEAKAEIIEVLTDWERMAQDKNELAEAYRKYQQSNKPEDHEAFIRTCEKILT